MTLSVQSGLAAPGTAGSLDPRFGDGGKLITEMGPRVNDAKSAAAQPDGKIVATGKAWKADGTFNSDLVVARYNRDGSLDPTFGDGGLVRADFGRSDEGRGVAVHPNGKIVVVAWDGSSPVVLRYNRDGTPDNSFGDDGKTPITGANKPNLRAVEIAPDGSIVAVGHTGPSAARDFLVIRLTPKGQLDATFGHGGQVSVPFPPAHDPAAQNPREDDFAFDVVLQPDGKIVAAGRARDRGLGMARLKPDGSLDTSFGEEGKVLGQPDFETAHAVTLQRDGKIVIAGMWVPVMTIPEGSPGRGDHDWGLLRYNPDGTLDSTFDGDGMVITSFDPRPIEERQRFIDMPFDVAMQDDGKIVAAGLATPNGARTFQDFGLARYNQDGSLDPTFGDGGKATTDFGFDTFDNWPTYNCLREGDRAFAVAISQDGITAVGTACTPGVRQNNRDWALARYLLR